MSDLFGVAGTKLLDAVELERGFSIRVESLRDLLEFLEREIEMLDRTIHGELRHDPALPRSRPGSAKPPGALLQPRSRMKKILVIEAHPRESSFCNSLVDRYVAGAEHDGAEVRLLRLRDLDLEPWLKYGWDRNHDSVPESDWLEGAPRS